MYNIGNDKTQFSLCQCYKCDSAADGLEACNDSPSSMGELVTCPPQEAKGCFIGEGVVVVVVVVVVAAVVVVVVVIIMGEKVMSVYLYVAFLSQILTSQIYFDLCCVETENHFPFSSADG